MTPHGAAGLWIVCRVSSPQSQHKQCRQSEDARPGQHMMSQAAEGNNKGYGWQINKKYSRALALYYDCVTVMSVDVKCFSGSASRRQSYNPYISLALSPLGIL